MTAGSNSALGAESLSNLMAKSLPAKASNESSPMIKDPYAAIGLFAHACMLAVGFRLVGLGEDHKTGMCDALGRHLHELTDFRCLVGLTRCARIAIYVGRHFDVRFSIRPFTIIHGIPHESQSAGRKGACLCCCSAR